MKLEEALAGFLTHRGAVGYSNETIHGAGCFLRRFINHLAGQGITTAQEVTRDQILRYLSYLNTEYRTATGNSIAKSTYYTRVGMIRSFFNWLLDTGEILLSPVPEPPQFTREEQTLPRALSEAQTMTLLEACPAHSLAGVRDRAILELFYSTGIRRGELVNLNVNDFSPERSELLIIQGKGRKDRLVPVGEYAAGYLNAYLQLVRPWQAAPDEPALFVSVHHGRRLCSRSINTIIHKVAERSGISRKVSPHTLRHCMATHLLRGGADIRHVQAILGHALIKTTAVYTHLDLTDLKRVVKESHPHGQRRISKGPEESED
jgi:integrase/recombinase XerD